MPDALILSAARTPIGRARKGISDVSRRLQTRRGRRHGGHRTVTDPRRRPRRPVSRRVPAGRRGDRTQHRSAPGDYQRAWGSHQPALRLGRHRRAVGGGHHHGRNGRRDRRRRNGKREHHAAVDEGAAWLRGTHPMVAAEPSRRSRRARLRYVNHHRGEHRSASPCHPPASRRLVSSLAAASAQRHCQGVLRRRDRRRHHQPGRSYVRHRRAPRETPPPRRSPG